jgi:exoribonuclease-2
LSKYKIGNLVIYHNAPAIITLITDKFSLLLKNGKTKKVRSKDFTLLHLGPINNLKELEKDLEGDIESTLELLEGETVDIIELAELMYDESSPNAVWKIWEKLQEGIYFLGTIEEITPNSKESIDLILTQQKEKEQAIIDWENYIDRVKKSSVNNDDLIKLKEVEQLAFGQIGNNRTMKALSLESTPEKAHQLLLKLNLWNEKVNPYPKRFKCSIKNPEFDAVELLDEERMDLTNLETFAIDGEHTNDPDDAVSLDGEYIWVHIADVAALITPNSKIDMESRGRGSTLYLPEKSINMIPLNMVNTLGLGLEEISPALSFKIKVNEDGEALCELITLSLIKVKRITYKKADKLIKDEPFLSISKIIEPFNKKRKENNVIDIVLPEVDIHVKDEDAENFLKSNGVLKNNISDNSSTPEININTIEKLISRDMVADLMVLTGAAVANWLYKNSIPVPYACQTPSSEKTKQPETLSEMIAYLKTLKRSKLSLIPGIHAGLGLEKYVRVTSPLRRYSDLLIHQQIRAFLSKKELMTTSEMEEKMTEAEFTSYNCTMASRLSYKHWKLFYIKYFSNKEFKAILIDKRGSRGIAIIPELAIEVKLQGATSIELDKELDISITDINMFKLELFGKILKK